MCGSHSEKKSGANGTQSKIREKIAESLLSHGGHTSIKKSSLHDIVHSVTKSVGFFPEYSI